MARLYELKAEFTSLLDQFEAGVLDDIPETVVWDTLDALETELRDKAVSIAVMVKDLKADIEAFKAEEDNLAKRRKSLENHVESLKSYLSRELRDSGVTAVKDDPRAQITFRKSESVEVTDEGEFVEWAETFNRPDLLNTKITVNKTNLKKSIKENGLTCPYASIVEKNNIQIK